MNKIVESRVAQLANIGFLKTEKELHALMTVLGLIEKSEKYNSIGDKRMIQERIQKEQISFINNMHEMFSKGDAFLSFYNYHVNGETRKRDIWRVVNLVEKRDTRSFSSVFITDKGRGKVFKKQGSKPKFNKKQGSKPKINKATPRIINRKKKKIEGSE
tara:strand:- start:1073 stop:1549 length:477 start_codon:yes stop_codon:yes gene_type:complete